MKLEVYFKTGKYDFGVVAEWGICILFLKPHRRFFVGTTDATLGHLELFQNKMRNAQQMPGGKGGGDGNAWN